MHFPPSAVRFLGGIPSRRARLGLFLPIITMLILNDANAGGPPAQPTSSQIQLALRKLGVVGSVLYVAAHPDDENTNLLAYLANERLLRTGYLSVTRGDGGQNLIGAEQGTDLGVIRTQELLAARRIDGAEQFFTRALDFGYSKNSDETLRIWDKDAVLTDMVWVIRRFRPDIIITRFSPELTDTHGHHTASARLAAEAFHAAADPTFHPEQLGDKVRTWQARRIFWNRSSWSIKPEEDMTDFLALDVNAYNPLLGLSYGEMAADSRSMHKSQGFGVARSRGPILEYFKLLDESDPPPPRAESVLGGIDFSWARMRGTAAIKRLVEKSQREFAPAAPYKVIPTLLQLDKALDDVPDVDWRAQKKAEVRDLVLACAGIFSEATAADFRAVPGTNIEVSATAVNRSPAKFILRELRFVGAAIADPQGGYVVPVQKPLGSVEVKRTLHIPADLPLTTPYWLASPPGPGAFHVQDPALVGLPEAESPLRVDFVFEIDGHILTVSRPITFQWTDPVAGERYRPVEIAPLVSIRPSTPVLVHPNGEARTLTVRLTAAAPAVAGVVRPEVPAGWTATPASAPFSLAAKGDEAELAFRIQPVAAADRRSTGTLRLVAEVGGARFSQGVHRIEHAHIPVQSVLARSEVRLVSFAIERRGDKIGYIPGPGDEVPASLRQVGYDVTLIGDEVLVNAGSSSAGLSRFDAIVVGVRAFNTNEKLRAAHPALMAYVQGGGTLVVQYNTNNRIAPLTAPIGPFPFEIGRERVTDENADVLLTTPDHRILTVPNKITERDFDGWIQERGLYFAANWDPRYQTVVSMGDPGESTLPGGILWTRYGKGTFVYTGLAFFRQLPAGVPGAFRLFANLLAGAR
jgi:LmbE family N-acetylglucosaminyl deacetylase